MSADLQICIFLAEIYYAVEKRIRRDDDIAGSVLQDGLSLRPLPISRSAGYSYVFRDEHGG